MKVLPQKALLKAVPIKLMSNMQKSEKGPQQAQSNTSKEIKGLMKDPSAPRMRYK